MPKLKDAEISRRVQQTVRRVFKWPKGKYNGAPIGGFTIKLTLDVLWWNWKPIIMLKHMKTFHWLFFHLWIEPSYRWHDLYRSRGDNGSDA